MPGGSTQSIQPRGHGDSPSQHHPISLRPLAGDNPAERWANPGDLEVALGLISTEPQRKAVMDEIGAIHGNANIRHWRSEAETYLLSSADLQRHQESEAFAAALNQGTS